MAPSADAQKNLLRKCATPTALFKVYRELQGIVLKAPLLLNINCAKILAKKFDFIACVKSKKRAFE